MKTHFEMAKEAGLRDSVNLERFADLVRADEREACAKVTGGQAFPSNTDLGMTLRDYAAIAAMQGMLAACTGWSESQQERLSKCSYSMADEMLKARQV